MAALKPPAPSKCASPLPLRPDHPTNPRSSQPPLTNLEEGPFQPPAHWRFGPHPSKSPGMSSKLSCTKEALVEDVDIAPFLAARKHRAMPTPTPARLSVEEISESPPDPIPMADQDHHSMLNPKDDNELAPKNDTQSNIGGVTTEFSSGSTADNRRTRIQQVYGNIETGSDSTSYIGNIFNHHYYSPALFGGLQALTSDVNDDAAIRYRRSRASNQSVPTMPAAYLPHASASQPEVKTALIKIALVCQFLDAAFAEYFRAVISPLPGTPEKLRKLREQICSGQSKSIEYIGSFGEYCERINAIDSQARMEKYQACATGDEIQPYLQDALEVPYWNMMTDQFIKSTRINNQFTYEAVLCVINDRRRELKLRLQQVKHRWRDSLPQEIEDGIARRIGVLDALLAQTSDKYDSSEEQQVQALRRSPTSGLEPPNPSIDHTSPEPAPLTAMGSSADSITDLEKVSLLSLFFLFTAIAMVPFGMGFAGNWNAETSVAVGSTSDPDFKWLIATTLLAIFGNIYAVVPLRKITRGSTANIISQVFLYFSIVLGIFSVSVYPFWNKAWSSSLSFFCSFFAIGSVFISAQHTSDTASRGPADALKVKKE